MSVNQVSSLNSSPEIVGQCYDAFIQTLRELRRYNVAQEIQSRLSVLPNVSLSDKFHQVDSTRRC
ncbi:MAG: hypothetical protein SAK29_10150 [Scytonema sp. PMC 1069.18]|nr:hypothetical protein [Scytonema sp. PMC 1069.18]MEC4881825.1 hypothetical protein [Scytonema sp. PMC 1070.18]